jgi:hypothetical protein
MFSLATARAELKRCAGSQFDPAVVAACERIPDSELLALLGAPAEGARPTGRAA